MSTSDAEVRSRADAGVTIGSLGCFGLHPGQKLGHVVRGKGHLGNKRHRHVGDAAEMIEVVHDVVLETVIEGRRRGLADVPDGDRVAIGRGLGDARHADRATGAADIFNDHSLTERAAHRFSDQARNRVRGAAGSRRDDECDRPRRKSTLCRCHIWRGRGCQS